MRASYPSDISRAEFEKIQPLLETHRKRTKPGTVDLYEIFCAILYILKSGCQWRMPGWKNAGGFGKIVKEKLTRVCN